MVVIRTDHQHINKCLHWGRTMWAHWLDSNGFGAGVTLRTCVTLEPIMRKHTEAIYFVFGPKGVFEEAQALTSEKREVCAESCIMMTTFHQASVSSSHRNAETTAERMSTCIYQEVGPYPCQQSLKYVNILMLFHLATTIRGSLDWWHLKMDSNYVQFVPFPPRILWICDWTVSAYIAW